MNARSLPISEHQHCGRSDKGAFHMHDRGETIATLEELRRFVADRLCQLESLKVDEFQLTQQVLFRAGKPCGIYFTLHGPRALRLSAIWEMDQNSVLFYGSCGRRVRRTTLAFAPMI
jgi:hypothetical protein